jgi:hypothetical protein
VAKHFGIDSSVIGQILYRSYKGKLTSLTSHIKQRMEVRMEPALKLPNTKSHVDHDRMTAAWQPSVPDWIDHLANLCDASSQREVADKISCSSSVICQLLYRTYKGSFKEFELRTREHLMRDHVFCPIADMNIAVSLCERNRGGRPSFDGAFRKLFQDICPTCPSNLRAANAGAPHA